MGPGTFVVVNPEAGGGMAGRLWPSLSTELKKEIGPFDSEETARAGDGRRLASEAAKAGYSQIIACGGDGTIHEVVNGICNTPLSERPVLGILSNGTGGDFIKTLGIPRRPRDQIRIVSGGKKRWIDLGHVAYRNAEGKKEERVFINIVDAGLGAEVLRRLPRGRQMLGRRLAYLTATLQSLFVWRPKKIEININNRTSEMTLAKAPDEQGPRRTGMYVEGLMRRATQDKDIYDVLSVIIANGRYFGGGMPIAPAADLSDGWLDLIVIREMNPLLGVLSIPLLFAKKLGLLPQVSSTRVREVTLSSDEKVGLDIDGEPIGLLPATFKILPRALKVIVP